MSDEGYESTPSQAEELLVRDGDPWVRPKSKHPIDNNLFVASSLVTSSMLSTPDEPRPRITRDAMMLEMAFVVAQRSTCSRLHVGAIIAVKHRAVSTGYNGAPSTLAHCVHTNDSTPCTDAVHAESNAIVFAARSGVAINGADLFVTHEPCLDCSKLIVNSGIKTVTYSIPYRLHDGVALLRQAQIRVIRRDRIAV